MGRSWTNRSSMVRWCALGAAFGVGFPVLAVALRAGQLGLAGAVDAFVSDPLLWIVATAPFFLGVFAAIGGRQNDGLLALTADLEARVAARTRDLSGALDRIQLITDGIADGVVSIDSTGTIEHASQVAIAWLGPVDGRVAGAWLFADATQQQVFELGLAQIAEDFLPFELCAAQLPHRTCRDGRCLELEYRAIDRDGGRAVLVVLHDITDRLASERAAAESRELQAVFTRLLEDPDAWAHFASDAARLLRATGDGRSVEGRRALHTLKGNAAVLGLARLASSCHDIETALADEEGPAPDVQARLAEAWRTCEAMVAPLAPAREGDAVRLARREIEEALAAAREGARVADTLASWLDRPLAPVLERLAREARRVAVARGREVAVEVRGGRLRAPDGVVDEIGAALLHVVRNAVDHGIEPAPLRRGRGKSDAGHLVMWAERRDGEIEIGVEDDGEGIDLVALAEKAAGAGHRDVPASELVFLDGLSSRSDASEVSGRGVGMGAARAACRALGGDLVIRSQRGAGTSVRITVPIARADDRARAAA